MKILEIDIKSPLFGKISAGAELIRVNGQAVADDIDYQFFNTEDTVDLEISENGRVSKFHIDKFTCGDLGLIFEETRIKICKNDCIFCFIHQQPKGMRRALYIKDDDYRYSFTHGNFITLSGMSDADFERIIEQRLSPLYISVHATDDSLRRCIFRNEKLEPILPRLKQLTENGIALQTQTVVCPGINDGDQLDRTITDLAGLASGQSYGGVESLAVVPVGLTRYRQRLPGLRIYTRSEAADVIDQVEAYQKRFLDRLGTRFVFPADEFFLLAERDLPPLAYYEDMLQFENGVGMSRQFIVDFNRRKRYLPRQVNKPLKLGIVTGRSAEPFMRVVVSELDRIGGMEAELIPVDNRFWGEMVTVTGLLTGKDIVDTVNRCDTDMVLLPPNCLNTEDLFLDDLSLDQFTQMINRPVLCGSYNFVGLVNKATALREN